MDENIRKLIDVNEIKTHSNSKSFVAAVEQSQPSSYFQAKWYQTYSLGSGYDKNDGSKKVSSSIPGHSFKVGEEISAMEAFNDPFLHADVRPKFFDKISKRFNTSGNL